jgi:uncharacterized surface protein with fasciclin (FAS1) repeats
MRKILFLILMVATVSMVSARAVPESSMETEQDATIVDLAASDERFSTLVTAVQAAGLAETLGGEGPFTLFAPTNDAFAALPEGTVEALLEDTEALTSILTYHVVAGAVPASEVTSLTNAETVQGQPVIIGSANGVTINDATVIEADLRASNGIIHVVDSVLLPPTNDIVEIAASAGSFSTLVTALQAADLVETLQGEGPFTVFAPTDDAFAKLPEGTVANLLNDIPTLTEILTYHVVPGRVFAGDVVNLDSAPTVQGQEIAIDAGMSGVTLDDNATVTATDILATNGVIHVIDSVILPE